MTYPDWHSEPDYKFTGELTYKGWAWEFLRRNPDYRSAYESFSDEAKAVELEYGADWRTNPEAKTYLPPKLAGESDQKWMKRCGFGLGLHPRRKWLDVLRGKRFGLARMFDPHSVTANTVAFLDLDPFPLIAELPDDLDGYVEEFDVFDPQSGQETGSVHQRAGWQLHPSQQEIVHLGGYAVEAIAEVERLWPAVVDDLPEVVLAPHYSFGHAGGAAGVEQPEVVAGTVPGQIERGCSGGCQLLVRLGSIGAGAAAVVDPDPASNLREGGAKGLQSLGEDTVEDDRLDVGVVP